MGCGAALSEHMDTNPKNGKTTASMKDYHVRNTPDLLNIRVELIEDGGTQGPFGAKSIGEACYVPVAAAVAGAVNDALDSELSSFPLTPDTIVDLMIKREQHEA
ncbi:Nicotinate dehydrogenase medium molybdopterin subunit [bioreactor metagenome]|uniref:Nicotinate dehydrogenase medium molybdopterin subunit n=1 Tax=bioreactor metagenome TaxID=1076179 RepID=A0A645HMF7_9ZZZZ